MLRMLTVQIEAAAQAMIDARGQYPDATLEEFYDPDNGWLYPALTRAHQNLDDAVEHAYGFTPGTEEKDIAAHLFDLYAKMIDGA